MSKTFFKLKRGANFEPQTSAPLDPDTGDLYYNLTDGLQIRTPTGWVAPGAGSGSGELNFIANPNDANQNWALSAGTGDLTYATTNTAAELPLEGVIKTAIKFTSSISGTKYAYTRFKVPDTLLTAKEKIEWYQKTISGFVASQWTVELWWNDNAAYTGTYTKFPLKNDVAGISYIPAITNKYYTQWTGTQAAQYLELRISRAAGTGASTFSMTNIIAGPGIYYVDQADLSPQMAGSIIPYSGPTTGFTTIGSDGTTLLIKNGWALCNGASISQTLYSQLFANIANTWDAGANQGGAGGNYAAPSASFFRIPDLRGVFLRGVGTSVKASGAGSVVKTLGQFSNDSTVANNMTAASSVTVNNTDLTHTHAATGLTVSGTNSTSTVTGTTNIGHSHGSSSVSGSSDTIGDHVHGLGYGANVFGGATTNPAFGGTTSSSATAGAGGHVHSITGTAAGQTLGLTNVSLTSGLSSAQSWSGSIAGSSTGPSISLNHAHIATGSTTLSSSDLDTAPRHTAINYLIKLNDAATVNVFNSRAASPFKAGFIVPGAQSVAPDGWLECGGQAVSRVTYNELFANIGTVYGSGDGSTTFNLPDLRGRVIAGRDDLGGTLASRLTNAIAGFVGTTLGANGGSQSLQTHVHAATGLTNSTSLVTGTTTASSTGSGTTGAQSVDHSHNFSGTTDSGLGGYVIASNAYVSAQGSGGPAIFNWNGSTSNSAHSHTFSGSTAGMSVSHTHFVPSLSIPSLTVNATAVAQTISGSTASTGAGASQNVQPTIIINYFIKAFNDTIDVSGFNVAGPTTTGFVTNSAQTLAGVKTFPDGIVTPSISSGPPQVLTGAGTITAGGLWVMNSAANFTANISSATGLDGTQITIKNINVGIVTLVPSGAETVDGQATVLLNQYDSITVFAYSGQWYVI